MLYRGTITTTIAGCGDVLQYQPIYEAKIITEFLPRKLCAIKAVVYSANPLPITNLTMEAVTLLST